MIITDHPDDESDYYVCDYCKRMFDENKFDYELHHQLDCEQTFCNEECAIAYGTEEAQNSRAADEAFYMENDLIER
jgi:hypothetical protein